MARQKLQRTLEVLHEQLESNEALGDADRAALLGAMNDIRDALSSSRTVVPDDPQNALSARLYGLIEDLEATHPKFAETLRNLSDSLANLGI